MKTNILLLFLFVLLFSCSENSKKETDSNSSLFSKMQLLDLNGKKVSLEKYKGKTIFFNFWATWCKPCIEEMPSIEKLQNNFKSEEFVFLLASDEKLERIKKFTNKYSYDLMFVKLEGSAMDYDITALPTTWIINKKGELVYNEVGALDWNTENQVKILREISK